jgi:hypothetical protein
MKVLRIQKVTQALSLNHTQKAYCKPAGLSRLPLNVPLRTEEPGHEMRQIRGLRIAAYVLAKA